MNMKRNLIAAVSQKVYDYYSMHKEWKLSCHWEIFFETLYKEKHVYICFLKNNSYLSEVK